MLLQQEELTCARGYAFTGSIDGFLAPCSCLLKHAFPTARAVSVAVARTEIMNAYVTQTHTTKISSKIIFNLIYPMSELVLGL